jgi:nucleoside phosphorylase
VLGEAAFCLRGIGRLSESLEPMRAGLKIDVELESWTNAAIAAANLSELELTLGRMRGAMDDATLAVSYADRSEDAFQRMARRTTLADARLAAGEWAQARMLFEHAEAMQARDQPDEPQFYSLRGHRYCELLLCSPERAAWCESATLAEPSELLSTCAKVFERATRAMKHAVRNRRTLDIALNHLTCGRAVLYAARIHRARLFHDRDALDKAATLIHQLGYHRRLGELEDAQHSAITRTTPTRVIVHPVAPAHRPDVAILIALPEEFETLARDYAERWTPQPNPDYHGSDFVFDGPNGYRCVAAIMSRMGPTVAGQVSQRLLAWRPAVIINVGIAGGFVDDLRIGDVIVPQQVDAYDETGKVKDTQWQRRGSDYRPNAVPDMHELRFAARQAHGAWVQAGARTVGELRAGLDAADVEDLIAKKLLRSEPIVSTNHLASGSFVVASKPFAEWIRSTNADIHAGEMEAAGMMAAAEYRREVVQTLVVRGISDHVDADKATVDRIGEGALRRLAMANAWRLVEMLMQLDKLPRSNASAEAPGGGAPPRSDASARSTAAADSPVLKIWRDKLAFLLEQEPLTVDPDAKYRLRHLVDEARAKIREHGGEA